jgi:hypothetical protein
MRNIENVSGFHAMFCHDPELIAHAGFADRGTALLCSLATRGFQESVPRHRHANSKQKPDWRVKQVFLKQVNNPVFHVAPRNVGH